MLNGTIDVAVHSLKDLPAIIRKGLVSHRRARARARLRTSSSRRHLMAFTRAAARRARRHEQRAARPAIAMVAPRPEGGQSGAATVQTRLAQARRARRRRRASFSRRRGSSGLGHDLRDGARSPPSRGKFSCESRSAEDLLPAIGQGAIALQSRIDRSRSYRSFAPGSIMGDTHLAIRAERELQRLLAGDCALPVGSAKPSLLAGAGSRMKSDPSVKREPRRNCAEAEADTPEEVAAAVFAKLEHV